MSPSDVIKPCLVLVRVRTASDEAIVSVVLDVLVQWHNVDVLQANVDADFGLAVPEEIALLFDVSDVIGRLQVTSVVQVFQEQIRRGINAKSYSTITAQCGR